MRADLHRFPGNGCLAESLYEIVLQGIELHYIDEKKCGDLYTHHGACPASAVVGLLFHHRALRALCLPRGGHIALDTKGLPGGTC
jgi:hypothetical protein